MYSYEIQSFLGEDLVDTQYMDDVSWGAILKKYERFKETKKIHLNTWPTDFDYVKVYAFERGSRSLVAQGSI